MLKIPPIASTRFQPPVPVGTWLERPRVDELLDQAVHQKLTLIHAPPGFGKSTLAAQWSLALAERGVRTGWLSLDHDDDRTLWFFSHLLDLFQRLFPDLDNSMREFLEETPKDAERYLIPLLVNAAQQSERRTVIVLDDWHVVKDTRTRAALAKLLETTGDKLGFIITSRTSFGIPLTELRIQDQLCEIDAQVLRFDERESHQFLVDVKGVELSDSEFSELHGSTEGWVAALQLSSVSLKKKTDIAVLLRDLASRQQGIGQYLVDNVLDTLDPRLRNFLLRTSVLTRINAELATLLSEDPESETMLEDALNGDLFLQRLGMAGGWYRLHHLFSAFLQERLKLEMPGLFHEMHRRAAHWYGSNSLPRLAVHHAMLAEENELAADIVERHAMLLIEHSRMSTLLALIEKLAAEETSRRPRLQLAMAWAYCLLHFPRETHTSLRALGEAIDHDAALSEEQRFVLSRGALVVHECLVMYQDEVTSDDRLQSDVLDQADRLEPWTVSVAANVLTFFSMNRNKRSEASALQIWAQPHHHAVEGSFSEVYGDCFSGLLSFQDLDTTTARAYWQRAYQVGSVASGTQSHAAWLPLGLLGKLHYHLGDLDRAEAMLQESLRVGLRAGVVDFMYPVYESLALVLMRNGDAAGAEDILKRGEEAGRELSLIRLWARMSTIRARLGLRASRPVAPPNASARERSYIRDELLRFDAASLLHSPGHVPSDLVDGMLDLSVRMCDEGNRFQGLRDKMTAVCLRELRGETDRAESLLEEILPLCESNGLMEILAEGGDTARSVIQRIVDRRRRESDGEADTSRLQGLLVDPTPVGQESGAEEEPVTAEAEGRGIHIPDLESLTPREHEILQHLAEGKTNREIATTLFLGVNTIKWYLRRLFRLLGVTDREQCVERARELGILT